MGVGSFKNTFDQFNKQIESVNSIIYQDSILDHNFSNNAYENVIEKEKLGQRLSDCPLLENVYDYLHWSEYSCKYGDLKEFVETLNEEKSNKNLNINLLELKLSQIDFIKSHTIQT